MAVKPEISLVSCQIRYELMRIAGTIPRAVDPKHHDRIVRDIVSNLSALEQSGLFDEVRLFSRTRECLYPRAEMCIRDRSYYVVILVSLSITAGMLVFFRKKGWI